ncbi:MAG: glutathione S-transferase N-terminal domain-containing protein [Chlamydiales bacterium]|nr:glutathione S-transferase N-terminal domain-containing protein [Chlamydiales bacterium]
MSKNILYSFRRCPFAIRARLVLIYGNASYEHREVSLKQKPKALIKLSPKATVPVFYTEGKVIDESLDIILWALTHLPSCDSLKLSESQHKEAIELIKYNDTSFKKALDEYKYPERYQLSQEQHRKAWHECISFLLILAKKINEHSFLLSNKLSFVDFAIFPFIRQCRKVSEEYFDSSAPKELIEWYSYIEKLELFEQVMKKHPLYLED